MRKENLTRAAQVDATADTKLWNQVMGKPWASTFTQVNIRDGLKCLS